MNSGASRSIDVEVALLPDMLISSFEVLLPICLKRPAPGPEPSAVVLHFLG